MRGKKLNEYNTPDHIDIDQGTTLYYTDTNAYPFITTRTLGTFYGKQGQAHGMLEYVILAKYYGTSYKVVNRIADDNFIFKVDDDGTERYFIDDQEIGSDLFDEIDNAVNNCERCNNPVLIHECLLFGRIWKNVGRHNESYISLWYGYRYDPSVFEIGNDNSLNSTQFDVKNKEGYSEVPQSLNKRELLQCKEVFEYFNCDLENCYITMGNNCKPILKLLSREERIELTNSDKEQFKQNMNVHLAKPEEKWKATEGWRNDRNKEMHRRNQADGWGNATQAEINWWKNKYIDENRNMEKKLNEEIDERVITGSQALADHLASIHERNFVSFCYLEKVDLVGGMRANKDLGPRLGYNNLAGIIKLTRYCGFQWHGTETTDNDYHKRYKMDKQILANRFGVPDPPPTVERNGKYTQNQKYGSGIKAGNTDNTRGHIYLPQNVIKWDKEKIKKAYFGVLADGTLTRELKENELGQIKITHSEDASIKRLMSVTNDVDIIERYKAELAELDSTMDYKKFKDDRIVFMVGTDKATGPFEFINDRLVDNLDKLVLNPQQIITVARLWFETAKTHTETTKPDAYMNESRRNIIKHLVNESVNSVLNEISYGLMKAAYDKGSNSRKKSKKNQASRIQKLVDDMYGGVHKNPNETLNGVTTKGENCKINTDSNYSHSIKLADPSKDATTANVHQGGHVGGTRLLDKIATSRYQPNAENARRQSAYGNGIAYDTDTKTIERLYPSQMYSTLEKAKEAAQDGFDKLDKWKRGEIDSSEMRTDIDDKKKAKYKANIYRGKRTYVRPEKPYSQRN